MGFWCFQPQRHAKSSKQKVESQVNLIGYSSISHSAHSKFCIHVFLLNDNELKLNLIPIHPRFNSYTSRKYDINSSADSTVQHLTLLQGTVRSGYSRRGCWLRGWMWRMRLTSVGRTRVRTSSFLLLKQLEVAEHHEPQVHVDGCEQYFDWIFEGIKSYIWLYS